MGITIMHMAMDILAGMLGMNRIIRDRSIKPTMRRLLVGSITGRGGSRWHMKARRVRAHPMMERRGRRRDAQRRVVWSRGRRVRPVRRSNRVVRGGVVQFYDAFYFFCGVE